jgi:hypothetical protein
MSRNPAVKPIAGPAPRPFVLHDRGKLCSTSVAAGMKCDTSELGTQGVIASFKPDLFLLIMQLVLFHEDISSRIASTRADRPDEFPNLNDNIWSQLVQLHPKLMQDFCQHQVLRHTKPDQKQIFKHHNFIVWEQSLIRVVSSNPLGNSDEADSEVVSSEPPDWLSQSNLKVIPVATEVAVTFARQI